MSSRRSSASSATVRPRYSVSRAPSATSMRSRTSLTTATFSALGFSIVPPLSETLRFGPQAPSSGQLRASEARSGTPHQADPFGSLRYRVTGTPEVYGSSVDREKKTLAQRCRPQPAGSGGGGQILFDPAGQKRVDVDAWAHGRRQGHGPDILAPVSYTHLRAHETG